MSGINGASASVYSNRCWPKMENIVFSLQVKEGTDALVDSKVDLTMNMQNAVMTTKDRKENRRKRIDQSRGIEIDGTNW